MSGKSSRRIVLRDTATADQVAEVARSNGWPVDGHVESNPEQNVPYEVIWLLPGGGSLHYVVDDLMDTRYVRVLTDVPGQAEQALSLVTAEVPTWDVADLARAVDDSRSYAELVRSVLQLGVGSPEEPDDRVVSRVSAASGEAEAAVRRAAVWAMIYGEWPLYEQNLAVLARDLDPRIAGEAQAALEQFTARHRSES